MNLATAQTGALTLQIGGAPTPPVPLVNHGDLWHYRFGTNAPQPDWKTAPDAALDASWLTGPGGFGYEDGDDTTVLSTMSNRFTTVYIRKSFEIAEPLDPARRVALVMDYDDGFVAWLDGVEVARSSNAPGSAGTEPAYSALSLAPNHEASAGPGGNPPTTFDLGAAGARLQPGTHVLALLGLNGTINSADFSLVADLSLASGAGTAAGGVFFSLVNTNRVQLSGSNTIAGVTRVAVNGEEATFNASAATWSKLQNLAPGMNRLFIAALDGQGAILTATNRDIICEHATRTLGGRQSSNHVWDARDGIVRVTNQLVFEPGTQLTARDGVVVLLSPGASIKLDQAGMDASGTSERPVFFLPADGTTPWGELSASGSNGLLTLARAEVVAGQVIAHPAARVSIEDSMLRDFHAGARLFLAATNAAQVALRRCQVARYDQIRFARSPVVIEDCLLEDIGSDATDLADHPDIQVRRTTYRRGLGSGTDALDLGNNPGLLIDGCLIHDFPDKGVSIAGLSHGVVVRHSLIYNVGIGIATYASSNCLFLGNTIAQSTSGLSLYVRAGFPGPGHATGTNNIIWGNLTNVHLANGATLALAYSDVERAASYPGTGNLNLNPGFVNPSAGDFRLAAQSPVRGTGADGADMGAPEQVGGIPPPPSSLAALTVAGSPITLTWQEDADNEAGFEVQFSTNGLAWEPLGQTAANTTNFAHASAAFHQTYFYRVRATNTSGASRFSNLASARRVAPTFVAGGRLSSNTTWFPALGTILVFSNVLVPSNLTLTILPGTLIKLTNGVSVRATNHATIQVTGTAEQPVRFQSMNTNALWGELSANGTNASLTVRHADIGGGQTTVYHGATGWFEDSYFHDYRVLSGGTLYNQPLMLTHFAAPTTVRRCHFREYHETLFRNGVLRIEDSLFEQIHGDGLDFDAAQAGTVLRRCTFRHGPSGNIDAVDVGNGDLGGSVDVLIEDCLMYNFPLDKGVSIGDAGASRGTVVRNCLIYGCNAGIMVKDDCRATASHVTLVDNSSGLTNYNKVNPSSPTGGGHITNYNSIIWSNRTSVGLANAGTATIDRTDLQGTNWPGVGNLRLDPRFLNAAERDYRLADDSPCRGAGRGGADLGARFPVGSPLAPSHPVIQSVTVTASNNVVNFYADSEKNYVVEWSPGLEGPWQTLAEVAAPSRSTLVSLPHAPLGASTRFYRLAAEWKR
jgi:hypothetical protein